MLLISGKLGKLVSNRERDHGYQFASNARSAHTTVSRDAHTAVSRDGSVTLRIVKQPESQHRARYLTEGSRGAVKDRTGASFPTLALESSDGVYSGQPAKLQIYVSSERDQQLSQLSQLSQNVWRHHDDGTTITTVILSTAQRYRQHGGTVELWNCVHHW